MEPGHPSDLARTVLRVAAAVLVGGWCSAAAIGLLTWTVTDRVAAFPVAYFALPLLAVFLVTYVSRRAPLAQVLATGWTGFVIGSLPVLALLPGQPSRWLASLAGLSVGAVAMAWLANIGAARAPQPRHRRVGATAS